MTAMLKTGRATQRLYLTVEVGSARADLTGKTIDVKMAMADGSGTPQTITATPLTQAGADMGRFSCDVTSANLTALGTPDQVLMVWNVWNADNSLFLSGQGILAVGL